MRYNTNINNVKANEWGLNIQQAYLFAWLYELPSWAEKVTIGKETFFFAAKNKAITELPILTKKLDTMYRYYKQLQEKDLIEIRKIDGKDYISLTAKAKEWNGSKSERSEINPNEVGNKSETPSEINPTYNNTIHDNKTNDDDVYKNIDTLIIEYLEDARLVKAVIENNGFRSRNELEARLRQFNKHLDEAGEYNKTPKDYKSHFRYWHKSQKKRSVSKSPTDITL